MRQLFHPSAELPRPQSRFTRNSRVGSPGFLAVGIAANQRPQDRKADDVDRHKGKHRHFMAKEIHEQPAVLGQTLAQYIDPSSGTIKLPKHSDVHFRKIDRVSITACGTAFYAGLVARYWLEGPAGIPCSIEVASEYRYRQAVVPADSLFLAISQSGETADTVAALREGKQHG